MLAVNSLAVEFLTWKNLRIVGAKAVSPSWRAICLGQLVITGQVVYDNDFLWDRALDKLLFSFSSIPLDFGSINYLKTKTSGMQDAAMAK